MASEPAAVAKCSTPEGIGSTITRISSQSASSSPAGAQRPRASARRSLPIPLLPLRHYHGVLNARGHRLDDHATPAFSPASRPGAQRPRASARRSRARAWYRGLEDRSAQRPRASARRSPFSNSVAWARSRACSTPEGIGSTITNGDASDLLGRRGAQRPRASARRSPLHGVSDGAEQHVLNARGHRLDDHSAAGAGCRRRWRGAQRPRASARRSPPHARMAIEMALCSTPEGIGSTITAQGNVEAIAVRVVLNARGHRLDDHTSRRPVAADRICAGAQRPRASARRSRAQCRNYCDNATVLNARGHRLDDHVGGNGIARVTTQVCSTPEGIGSTITWPARR